MLDRCQAYLIAKAPAHVTDLRHVVGGRGSVSASTSQPAAELPTLARRSNSSSCTSGSLIATCFLPLATIRASYDDNLRFSPFVLIINDCAYEDIIKYVHLGFDDVISLPERRR